MERTTEYLEAFFRNLMMGEHNELKNCYLHIKWKEIKGDVVEEPMEYGLQESSKKTGIKNGKVYRKIYRKPMAVYRKRETSRK